LQTWATALLVLGVSYMRSSDAADAADAETVAAFAGASSSSSSERRRIMNVKSSSKGCADADVDAPDGAAASAATSSSSSLLKNTSKASAAAVASVPSFAEEAWIREYDSLLKTSKGRQTAELNLYNSAVRFFIMQSDEEHSKVSPGPDDFLEPTPDLDVHQTVECAQHLIDDLNVRYTDCSPNHMDVFEVCLKVYNLRLTTQLDILGISRPELRAEFTHEELKITIQVRCVGCNQC
jgi:hypothetical protein